MTSSDLASTASDAYVYAYPLVLTDTTIRLQAAGNDSGADRSAVNQLIHRRRLPDATSSDLAPDVDTLCSSASLDLNGEPIVLALPETNGRYFSLQLASGWSDIFASAGTRSGSGAARLAITGPGWQGHLPDGVQQVRSPTAIVMLLIRIYCAGAEDYEEVHRLQDGLRLVPLSAWGSEYQAEEAPVHAATDVRAEAHAAIAALDAAAFFSRFANLLDSNPPQEFDAPLASGLPRLGIVPGSRFDYDGLDRTVRDALQHGVVEGTRRIRAEASALAEPAVNGWEFHRDQGHLGTRYLYRAALALRGLDAALPEDLLSAATAVDARGDRLNGGRRYLLGFEPGTQPPVNAFWSLTVYDARMRLVETPPGRYSLGSRGPARPGPDGSLPLLIQQDAPPQELAGNWLPCPAGDLSLVLRLHWPRPEAWDGRWMPPPVLPDGQARRRGLRAA